MVRTNTPAAKSVVTMPVAELRDRLIALSDEIVDERTHRGIAAAGIWILIFDVEKTAVAPVAGGCDECRDDHEEVDPEFLADPTNWPAWTDEGHWVPTFDGPTPLDVLERDVEADDEWTLNPTPETVELRGYTPGVGDWSELRDRFVPSQADWDDFHAWCDASRISERDLVAAGLAV